MKTTLKGTLVKVSKIETIARKDGNGTFKTCMAYVYEKAITNDYGEEVKPGQTHEIKLFNKNLDQLPPEVVDRAIDGEVTIDPPEPVEMELYVNTRQVNKVVTEGKKQYDKLIHIVELNPRVIKFPMIEKTVTNGAAN